MSSRSGIALVICLVAASSAAAQVVRFQTSVGDFDMVLNPTDNPVLQGHVDNMLQYVEDDRYDGVWINRADEGFVLQLGGFYAHTRRPPPTIDSTRPVFSYGTIEGEPAAENIGLSNTSGTVAMALPGNPTGGTNQDGGSNSFFVNLSSNTFLDADFTVFAAIPDLTVVNQIMDLMKVDRTTEDLFGAGPGNLAFTDVPVQENGHQVFIDRAFVVTDPLAIARARAGIESTMATSAASFAGGGSSAPLLASTAVPEPASLLLALLGVLGFRLIARPRR